jgi:MATE family multidrug resistance protein
LENLRKQRLALLAEEARALVRLALPVVAAQLGLMSLGVIDTIMVGHLSAEALGAVAVGNFYSWGLMIVGQGVLLALDPLISQAHGAGDRPAVSLALQRGLVLSLLISIPFAIAFQHAEPVLRLLKQPPAIIPAAAQFTRNLAPGLPAFFAFIVLRQALQAMSVVRPVMWSVLVGIAANIFLNLGFIYGHFGMPALGAPGTAISTSIGRYLMLGTLAAASWSVFREVWDRPTRRLFEVRPYARMLAIGVPTGIQYGLEVWVFMTVSVIMGTLGTTTLDGHQIAMNLASISFMVPLGVGAAAATRVGNAVGRGDGDGARRAAVVSMVMGAGVMTISALSFALMPNLLARIYTNDSEVIAMTATLLPIAALFQIFDGIQAVGCGVLRGVAGTVAAAIINLVGYWVLGLPLGLYLAFRLGWGPRGLWWGLTAGLMAVAVLLILRVRSRFAHDARLTRVPSGEGGARQ